MKKVDWDGPYRIQTVFQPHEGRMYVRRDSEQTERTIAGQNKRLRQMDQTGAGNTRMHLQMSPADYEELCREHPVLRTGDTHQRREAWLKIAKSHPHLVAMEFKRRLFAAGVRDARQKV